MSELIIFGGTTEGRELACWCAKREIKTVVCVVSDYGEMLLPDSKWLQIETKALDEQGIERLIEREKPGMVLDATHPYAKNVTANLVLACEAKKVKYIRILRESLRVGKTDSSVVWAESASEAVKFLAGTRGNILLTTGSKELPEFLELPDFEERIYPRMLPDGETIKRCEKMGFLKSHIIAMQGPFSLEMNKAMLRMVRAEYLVTKESGKAGGFLEKIEAAMELGVSVVVIGRPVQEDGISLNEAYGLLAPLGKPVKRKMYLVGIGMGGPEQLTLQAEHAIKDSQGVAGARRMLESVNRYLYGKETFCSYKDQEILQWMELHPEMETVSVVYSGDPGFYSGARQMTETALAAGIEVETIAGISTVSYLCARLGIPWQDIYLGSIHGRNLDILKVLEDHPKVFLLLGGEKAVQDLCRKLGEHGYENVQLSVGEKLSYKDERIVTGNPEDLEDMEFDSLCAAVIQR